MADVCVRVAAEDKEVGQQLVAALAKAGFDVFPLYPQRSKVLGATYAEDRARRNAKCVVVVWSESSIFDDFLRRTAKEAKDQDALVSAVVGNSHIPQGFSESPHVDLTGWTGDADRDDFLTLKRLVGSRVQRDQSHSETPRTDVERLLRELERLLKR